MSALEARLGEARDRLRGALLSGKDSSPHRQAIQRIQADIDAASLKADQVRSEEAMHQAERIAERSDAIRAASSQRITALIARFPIPTRTSP